MWTDFPFLETNNFIEKYVKILNVTGVKQLVDTMK